MGLVPADRNGPASALDHGPGALVVDYPDPGPTDHGLHRTGGHHGQGPTPPAAPVHLEVE